MDVTSLYKHIPRNAGIRAVKNLLARFPRFHTDTDTIIRLLELTPDCNVFTFNDVTYLQEEETRM